MTANHDAASVVLRQMGVPADSMDDGLAATEAVVNVFHPADGVAVTAEWECAAELVASFHAVTGFTGPGLRSVLSIARAAYKLKRF